MQVSEQGPCLVHSKMMALPIAHYGKHVRLAFRSYIYCRDISLGKQLSGGIKALGAGGLTEAG